MKRERLKGLRWSTAALRAVFLALSALCAWVPAQAGPTGAPGAGCIPLAQATNTMTPPSLFAGVAQCVAKGDYDAAARLSALAGIYLHFDVARVSDRSAAGGAAALPMLATKSASPEQKDKLVQSLGALANEPARLKSACSDIARIGRPAYYPQYLITEGMGAFIGEPKQGPLVPNFDAAGTWKKLQASYLKCPSSQEAQQTPGLLSKILGDHMNNDVAVKVAELPEKYRGDIVNGVAFSADGSQIAVDSNDELINIWDWRSSRISKTIEKAPNAEDDLTTEPLRYSPDGKLFAACHSQALGHVVARIWNTQTWEIIHDITDSGAGGCDAIGFTPDGQYLIRVVDRVGSPGENLIVYGVGAWQPIWGLQIASFSPTALTVSPDGEFAAIGGSYLRPLTDAEKLAKVIPQISLEPQIRIVDMRQRKVVRVIQNEGMDRMAWSPDGSRIVVAWALYTDIFDARSGERLMHEKKDSPGHATVRFTPDGRYLIESSANAKGTGSGIKIWDGLHKKLLQKMPDNIWSLSISRDGRYFAAGETGKTTVWQFK